MAGKVPDGRIYRAMEALDEALDRAVELHRLTPREELLLLTRLLECRVGALAPDVRPAGRSARG